jgi:hypothetical protein
LVAQGKSAKIVSAAKRCATDAYVLGPLWRQLPPVCGYAATLGFVGNVPKPATCQSHSITLSARASNRIIHILGALHRTVRLLDV